jgi:dipeptidyl-peptidase-4
VRTSIRLLCFFLIAIIGTSAVGDVRAQKSQEPILREAESRLHAIYDRDEFRPKRFRADWLPDTSGYVLVQRIHMPHLGGPTCRSHHPKGL